MTKFENCRISADISSGSDKPSVARQLFILPENKIYYILYINNILQ